MSNSELARRIAVAAVGIPLAVAVAYFGGWVLGGVLAVIAALAAAEFYRLAARGGTRPFVGAGMLAAGAIVLIAAADPDPGVAMPRVWGLTVAVLLLLGAASIWFRGVTGGPLSAVSTTVVGALYPGATLAYAVLLRHADAAGWTLPWGGGAEDAWRGAALLFFPIVLTWTNDSCAYFAGTMWGRRKLIPTVSPGKTVEGSVAGLAGTVAAGAVYAYAVLEGWLGIPLGPGLGALGGVLVAMAAQIGDLLESVLKREADVKDSGRIFPGHGGVLDRFDALFFTLPVMYWYLSLVLFGGSKGIEWLQV